MKRTGEIVLAIIGVILSGLFAIGGLSFNALIDNPEFQEGMNQGINNDPTLTQGDIDAVISIIESVGPFLLVVGLISVILGIIGAIAIKGNKKPVLAGIMFILAALVIGLGTIGIGFLPGILFLIAGIMSFVRKPKVTTHDAF
ncbi:uncharacterized membrane protein YbaN (DUF454 family) [Bacillus pakistanensis]|uniref:Uncharacterized membrane protein YbaN (DUF454 family) n=1 Tax=Rossellomorea pakistanensis TaxID=992288 RepID=A0ABS2N7N2_9BACI|nr:DUF4064 domain-containing protein [Bacillus pakistanensis]MBM7583862.1 uncharacterized membrane protein YbaN (DUF454 family) [Bacillus pakistanensis]